MSSRKMVLLFIAVFISIFVFSQEKKPAIISGIVKDARNKLPLPEAVITIKANSFQGEKYALTDSTGKYRVNNLPPGMYTVTFEMEGYEKFSQDSIVVSAGMSLGVSFEMIRERKKFTSSQVP